MTPLQIIFHEDGQNSLERMGFTSAQCAKLGEMPTLVGVLYLARGTSSGEPAVMVVGKYKDGPPVIMETTLKLFEMAAKAMAARRDVEQNAAKPVVLREDCWVASANRTEAEKFTYNRAKNLEKALKLRHISSIDQLNGISGVHIHVLESTFNLETLNQLLQMIVVRRCTYTAYD